MKENENTRTSLRLREKKQINTNEDFMSDFSQVENKNVANLICNICDKPFIYEGRLKLHMKKLHGISNYTLSKQVETADLQIDSQNVPTPNNIEDQNGQLEILNVHSIPVLSCNIQHDNIHDKISENSLPIRQKTVEHLSYEELRKLLPKECSLQPLINGKDGTDVSKSLKTCSLVSKAVQERNQNKKDSNNISRVPVNNFSATDTPIQAIEKSKSTVVQTSRRRGRKPGKLKAKRGIVRHSRIRKRKSKSCQLAEKNQIILSGVMDSSPLEKESQTAHFNMPKLSSAIEISIVTTNKSETPLLISQQHTTQSNHEIHKSCEQSNISSSEKTSKFSTCNENEAVESMKELNEVDDFNYSPPKKLQFPQKKKRGRPKIKNNVPIPMRRGRGRPKSSQVLPARPGLLNYNLTTLPYGDFGYLANQSNPEDEDEPPVIMEPLVEINMDQNEINKDAETSQSTLTSNQNAVEITRIMAPDIQNVQDPEDSIKKEQTDNVNSEDTIDISEIENKIGLIGECTISVAS